MSETNFCETQTIGRDLSHLSKGEFNFNPKFKWEGVVIEILELSIKGEVYDELNDLTSEVEISKKIIANHQLFSLKVGNLFNLYSGENIITSNEELLFELKKEPFHITSFDDLIDMYSHLDISKNIKYR